MIEQYHGTWGRRVVTRIDPYSITTILYLDPRKRCSWHYHDHAYNQFFVIKGKLEVKTDIGPDNQRNRTMITEGQSFTVQPKIKHEFRTFEEPTIIEEIAYVKYETTDIHREMLGGNIGNYGGDWLEPDLEGVDEDLAQAIKRKHLSQQGCY